MLNISYEDGVKEYTINNDPKRVLRFNPKDIGLIERLEKSSKEMQSEMDKLKDVHINMDGTSVEEETAEVIRHANSVMRKAFDGIFYSGASNIVFGKQNPLSVVGGKSLYENVMNALIEVLKPAMEEESKEVQEIAESNNKVNSYKEKYEELRKARNQ